MLKTIEGIYRDGQIRFTEQPQDIGDRASVLVTFLDPDKINSVKLRQLSLFYQSRQKIDRNYEEKSFPTENLLVYLTGRINGKILAVFEE